MKAIAILMIALLLLPVLAIAENTDLVETDTSEDESGTIVAPSTTTTSGKPLKIKTLAVLGKGIAVSPSDAMDFKMVKIGIGTVYVELLEETTSITVGVMFLDEDKYKLKEIVISEGEAKGNIYTYSSDGTETLVGSFETQSVMKGDQEVWAGTLTVSGATYYLYILEAPRKVNADEYRDKVAEYCREHPTDENCRDKVAEYCKNNVNDKRCQALFMAHCVKDNNLEDTRCRDFAKRYCEENPEKGECRVLAYRWSNKYCQENSGSGLCIKINAEIVEFCLREPNNEKCREFCAKYPDKCKQVVKSLADFCINNAEHVDCIQYCTNRPAACKRLASNLIDLCIAEPNREGCIDYCKEHPVACGKVTYELARFCIGNEVNEKCKDFCRNYPNACMKVAGAIDTFCEKYPSKPGCEAWCERYPARCATGAEPEPTVADISELTTAVATNEGG